MYTVFDQGPGKTLFQGTYAECVAFKAALPADVSLWCKIF